MKNTNVNFNTVIRTNLIPNQKKSHLSGVNESLDQGILSTITRIIQRRSTGNYSLLILAMCIFLFSCEEDNISKDNDVKIEIPVKEDYLSFSSYDQFTKFLQSPDDFKTPESFQSLSSYLSILMKDYLEDGSHSAELSDYYLLTEGRVPRPEYKYFSFMG